MSSHAPIEEPLAKKIPVTNFNWLSWLRKNYPA